MAILSYSGGSWRIRPGTWDAVDLTEAYAFTAFPTQDDQPGDLTWYNPAGDQNNAVAEVSEITEAFDGSRGGYGDYEGRLVLPVLTPGMVHYVRTYLFGGRGTFSAAATLMIWDRSQGWIVINCTIGWNEPARNAEARGRAGIGGYFDLPIDYYAGTIADEGNALITEDGFQIALETGDILLLE